MKTTTVLFLLSAVSSTNVLSITASANNADELNFNLRHTANIKLLEGAQNKHQCYNHCQRHTGKSNQWIKNCEEDCDRQYDPSPTPAPTELQCYNLGDECETDDDCLTGGFNPCNKCGTTHGTEYYQRCYAEPVETPAPTPAPYEQPQCYNLGDECETDNDCMTGGFNPCNKCGKTRGTDYYQRCYSDETPAPTPEPTPSPTELQCYNLGDECDTDEDCMTGGFNPCTKCGNTHGLYFQRCYSPDEDVVLIESDEDEDKVDWEKTGNWTRKAADSVADGTKKAAQKTAEGTKKAAEATKDWGKRTFTDDNSSSIKSSSIAVVAGIATFAMLV